MILRGEDLGMIGVERERSPVVLLLTESEEALDRGTAVRAAYPLTLRTLIGTE